MLARITSIIFILLTAACAQPAHLIHYQRTVIGLDASGGAATGSSHITFGYDRRLVSFVPKTDNKDNIGKDDGGEGDSGKKDDGNRSKKNDDNYQAMSVLSCSHVRTGFVSSLEFRERLATGDAAVDYAKGASQEDIKRMFNCAGKKK